MTNVQKLVDELVAKLSNDQNECVVLRFDNLITFEAVKNHLLSFDGVTLINGEIKEFHNKKCKEAKVIVADPLLHSKPMFDEYKHLAETHNCSLIFLELLSGLSDDAFDKAKIIQCHDDRALTSGNLIEKLNNLNNPDSIIVYSTGSGLYFAEPSKNGRGYFSETLNSVMLQAGEFQAFTVEQFVCFLKTFPSDTILSVLNLGIITSVINYKHNVIHLSATTKI